MWSGCVNIAFRLNKICLRIIYSGSGLSFEDLLRSHRSFTIHVKNVQTLATEVFKVSKNVSNPKMNEIFEKQNVIYKIHHNF